MAPPTAPAAEGVCSGFLEGLDFVTEARKVGLLALHLKLFLELLQAAAALLHVAKEAGAMDLHPPPPLEGTQAGNARAHGARYPEDQISVPEEGLRRGKWGGNAEEAAVYGLA